MKRLQYVMILMITASLFASCSSTGWMSDDPYEDESYYGRRSNVSMDLFMQELSPFGQWVNMPRYGQVWITNERGFRPYYSGGRWADTRYGYTWVSDYKWGWAPFHYGKWGYDQFYGWFWVPGYDWSPAWVNWRYSNNYYGWSPYMVNGANEYNNWTFMDQRYMNDPRMRDRYLIGDQYRDLYRNSQPIDRPRINTNTYRQQQQQRDYQRDNEVYDRRSIYRDATPNTRSGVPSRDVIERPSRIEIDRNKVERLDRPAQIQQPQQSQRAASEIIRQNETREFKKELPQRERPAEIKKERENQ
jgi:hypothetical protein